MSESIRPYRAEDVEAVREVHLRAFDGRGEEARLVELLHAAGAAPVSLVATVEPDGRVVGHVLFSPVQIDGRRSDPPTMVGLAPVAVVPEYQGRGIGSRLIREGLRVCREAGYGAAVVLGRPGLLGLHARLEGRGGPLGKAGVLVAYAALAAALVLVAPLPPFYAVAGFGPFLGLVLVGSTTLQARIFPPPWSALPLAVGLGGPILILAGGGLALMNERLLEIPIVLVGLAWMLLGYSVLAVKGAPVQSPARVT